MTTCTDTIREVDSRTASGITVTLSGFFSADGDCLFAIVAVDSPTENFTISEIPLSNALDVYHHPYYYAERELLTGKLAA